MSRRAVLVLHELDDIPVVEVASVLGIPKFTVYSRLRKGRTLSPGHPFVDRQMGS